MRAQSCRCASTSHTLIPCWGRGSCVALLVAASWTSWSVGDVAPALAGLELLERLHFFRAQFGFAPRTVLDVGANRGDWSATVRSIFPNADWLLVEANPQHREALEATGLAFEIALLASRRNETRTFYMTDSPWPDAAPNTGASLFRERTPYFADGFVRRVQIDSRVLDDVVEGRFGGPDRCCDFVKLDVQGAELEVLKGGLRTLALAQLVLLETSVLPYNDGAPLFSELVGFLAAHGFELVDVVEALYADMPGRETPAMQRPRRLLQLDLLFAPRTSNLLRWGQD